jgi:diguanylate cyclase (GGDEF)-like protein
MLEHLARLAVLANAPDTGEPALLSALGVVESALKAQDVYLVHAGDPDFRKIGENGPSGEYDIKQKGYWLLWQALAREPSNLAVLAVVEDRLVHGWSPVEAGNAGNYLATLLPSDESNSEVLVVRWDGARSIRPSEIAFLEAARPSLCRLTGRVLDLDRLERHGRQLAALADVARAFNNTHDLELVVSDLATAMAKASGFDWVTINVYDDGEELLDTGTNLARHSSTETARMARGGRLMDLADESAMGPFRARMRRGEPVLLPDVFDPAARNTPELLAYYQRAHILSLAWFPLMFQGRLLGTVSFSSSLKRKFDDATVDFLADLAAQAATAVKGMRLYRDLEEKKEQLEAVSQVEHFLARTDALTGLPNRRYLDEVLAAEQARMEKSLRPLSVAMADLDCFKLVNDGYGHPVGDEALRLVASIARASVRESDFVGRWGGDEFLFVLPSTDVTGAEEVGERFREGLERSIFKVGSAGNHVLTATVGIAHMLPGGSEATELLVRRADQALYEAKAMGKNRVRVWSGAARAA